MRKSIAVSTLLSIAFTVVLTIVCCLLSRQILVWMQIPDDIAEEANAICSSFCSAPALPCSTT